MAGVSVAPAGAGTCVGRAMVPGVSLRSTPGYAPLPALRAGGTGG